MNFVLSYLKEYKRIAILAPLFKMLEAVFELLVPLVMARIIDVGIAARDREYIFRMCMLLIALAFFGMVVAITAQYFAAKAAALCAGRMRADLFSHIMDLSDASMDECGAATLITRENSDLNQVQAGINMFLRLFLRSPFIVLGATVMAGTISLQAAGLFVLLILVLSLGVGVISRITMPMFRRVQEHLDRIMTIVGENLEGVRVIRAFGIKERERKRFGEQTESLYVRQKRSGDIQAFLNPLTFAAVNLTIVVLLYFSKGFVYRGTLTQGEVVALLNYLSQILVELIKFATLIILITRGLASAGRVEAVMKRPADERKKTEAAQSGEADAVVCENLSFAYAGSTKNVLSEVSFTLKRGETLGIVGGTGAGKSTLAKLLTHAYDAGAGEITLFGKSVSAYADEELGRVVSVVPQNVELFTGTVEKNLRMAKKGASDEELWEALSDAQASDFIEERKGGLSAEVMRGARNFSGGQRQRLSIARSLCADPALLILDDASSALDRGTEKRLLSALRKKKDRALIIISQRASSVRRADKVLVLENGWCVGLGSHEELMEDCEVYREIVRAQFPEDAAPSDGKEAVS